MRGPKQLGAHLSFLWVFKFLKSINPIKNSVHFPTNDNFCRKNDNFWFKSELYGSNKGPIMNFAGGGATFLVTPVNVQCTLVNEMNPHYCEMNISHDDIFWKVLCSLYCHFRGLKTQSKQSSELYTNLLILLEFIFKWRLVIKFCWFGVKRVI